MGECMITKIWLWEEDERVYYIKRIIKKDFIDTDVQHKLLKTMQAVEAR